MSSIVLSQTTVKNLTDAVDIDLKTAGKWRKACDAMISDGVSANMLDKPAKGETNKFEALHNQVNALIVSTFSAHVQTILQKETKTLSDQDKETKRYWSKQIGSYFRKVQIQLQKAQDQLLDTKESTPRVVKSKIDKIKKALKDAIELAQSLENPAFDVTDFVKEVKLCSAMVI
jgi:hypothetical protein